VVITKYSHGFKLVTRSLVNPIFSFQLHVAIRSAIFIPRYYYVKVFSFLLKNSETISAMFDLWSDQIKLNICAGKSLCMYSEEEAS